ncbi:MAG: hypothetical protein U1F49_00585 [Rubrivivax sp.]
MPLTLCMGRPLALPATTATVWRRVAADAQLSRMSLLVPVFGGEACA